MNDLAERHRRIADVVEPLERMGVEATVDDRTTDDGDLYLSLELRIPETLEAIDVSGGAVEHLEALEAECERLREQRDALAKDVEDLEEEVETVRSKLQGGDEELDRGNENRRGEGGAPPEPDDGDQSSDTTDASGGDLTDGERETLDALQAMGGARASGEIADRVDATLQSVRSWLPKLVKAGYIRTEPDPTDGRRKLYAAVDPDETVDEEDADAVNGTVYIASAGGSPSQVFHVREDCPQLQKSTDCVEKDRAVVPHHRPCSNCVPAGLPEGLVAVAKGSSTTTYHEREDCPKLGSANNVVVQGRETVPNHDPCDDCVSHGGTQSGDEHEKADEEKPGAPDDQPAKDSDQSSNEKAVEQADAEGDEVDGRSLEAMGDKETAERGELENGAADGIDDPGTMESGAEHVPSRGDDSGDSDGSAVAAICARHDLHRESIVDALDGATAIYHVQRDLTLSSDETEALLRGLGLFEELHGGGRVPLERVESGVRTHVPSSTQREATESSNRRT